MARSYLSESDHQRLNAAPSFGMSCHLAGVQHAELEASAPKEMSLGVQLHWIAGKGRPTARGSIERATARLPDFSRTYHKCLVSKIPANTPIILQKSTDSLPERLRLFAHRKVSSIRHNPQLSPLLTKQGLEAIHCFHESTFRIAVPNDK
jgi:hypothetical protein